MSDWTPERIRDLRKNHYHESQAMFARRFRVHVDTYRWWERARGLPSGPAELLLDRLLEDAELGKIRPHPEPAMSCSGAS